MTRLCESRSAKSFPREGKWHAELREYDVVRQPVNPEKSSRRTHREMCCFAGRYGAAREGEKQTRNTVCQRERAEEMENVAEDEIVGEIKIAEQKKGTYLSAS